MTMTKAEAGRLGGLRTVEIYGKEHMRTIGEIGAMVFHEKYSLQPFGTSDYAIVDRQTNQIINTLSGTYTQS